MCLLLSRFQCDIEVFFHFLVVGPVPFWIIPLMTSIVLFCIRLFYSSFIFFHYVYPIRCICFGQISKSVRVAASASMTHFPTLLALYTRIFPCWVLVIFVAFGSVSRGRLLYLFLGCGSKGGLCEVFGVISGAYDGLDLLS